MTSFGQALEMLQAGKRVIRLSWNKGQYVNAQCPGSNSKMTVPYLYMGNDKHELTPWQPSQKDLFAMDWALYAE